MDGDLQHLPEEIPLFLEKLNEGYDVVSGWRKNRVDNLVMRKIPSRAANWLASKISGVDIHDFGTTFKAYRREIIEEFTSTAKCTASSPRMISQSGAKNNRNTHHQYRETIRLEQLWNRQNLQGRLRFNYPPIPPRLPHKTPAFLRQSRFLLRPRKYTYDHLHSFR